MNDHSEKLEAPDPLDALLRDSEPHLPDDGFTARVLVSLPPRRRVERARLLVFAVAWLAGVVILVSRAPAIGAAVTGFFEHARHGDWRALGALAPIMLVFGSLVWALVSWSIEEWA